MSDHRVEYDRIAATYDGRYRTDRYADADWMLREWIAALPPGRLLEVGCGTGHWLHALFRPGWEVLGLDRSSGMLSVARKTEPRARLLRGEATPLPLADRSVQALLCMNAFHHFPDKPAFITEASRVLAPGGAFCTIALDPHAGRARWPVYEYFEGTLATDLERYPPTREIRRCLREAGFSSIRTQVAQHIRTSTPASDALRSPMMRRDGTSQLALLSDDAYERGLQAIQRAAALARQAGKDLVLETDLELMATLGTRQPE